MPQVKERVPDKTILAPHAKRPGPVTYDEFCDVIHEYQKADLIDGVIHVAPPDSLGADQLYGWLRWVLDGFLEHHALGQVYGSRVALRLGDRNGPEPDLAVVLAANRDRAKPGHILGPCDLAVEIVSPESVERDYVDKRRLYESAGVPEYWIIDEDLKRVTQLRLGPKGYTESRPRKGVVASKVLPGFWLRAEWLWQNPRRKKADVLAEILAGPPG